MLSLNVAFLSYLKFHALVDSGNFISHIRSMNIRGAVSETLLRNCRRCWFHRARADRSDGTQIRKLCLPPVNRQLVNLFIGFLGNGITSGDGSCPRREKYMSIELSLGHPSTIRTSGHLQYFHHFSRAEPTSRDFDRKSVKIWRCSSKSASRRFTSFRTNTQP